MNESQDSNDSSANNTNDIRQQEAEHQGAAVKAALGANIGVAIAKLAAAFFTGSSAMLPNRCIPSPTAPTKSCSWQAGASPSTKRTVITRSACIAPNISPRS